MTILAQNYVGCDVSKATLDFFDPSCGRHSRIDNDREAIRTWIGGLQSGRDFVVMEATGVHDRCLRHELAQAGIDFSRHNPQHTYHFSRQGGRRAKTDRRDAVMLAEYGLKNTPAPDPKPDEKTERLQSLARRRDQLVDIRAVQKRQLAEAFDADVVADIEALIAILDGRIKAIEGLIAKAVRETGQAAQDYALLTSAPGVAAVTALTLIAHMTELGRRSPKAIAALAGLAPIANESGKAKYRSSIAGGRPRVRRALYMAALAAIRACPRYRTAYQQIAARSGSKKLAIIAVARKLLVALNAMIRDRKQFA